jgi:hypothetical protein
MNNKKMTAVEILEKFLREHCNPSYCNIDYNDFNIAIQDAKEIEQEEKIAYAEEYTEYAYKVYSNNRNSEIKSAEEYYKEKYEP